MSETFPCAPHEAVARVCTKYACDLAHARHVAMLSEALFDGFLSISDCAAPDRVLLRHAALLHDIGYFVAAKRHHRHSAYLVRSDALLGGFPTPDRDLLARVVRNHRRRPRSGPKTWSTARQLRLAWLSALLRVADALDVDHTQQVRIARVQFAAPGIELELQSATATTIRRAQAKADLLRKLVDGRLTVRQGAS